MARWNVVMKDYPAGNGFRNILFYMQSIISENEYQRYDYGAVSNMDKYGQAKPPTVPLG